MTAKRVFIIIFLSLLLPIFSMFFVSSVNAFTTNMSASVVIGQNSLTVADYEMNGSTGANTLSTPYAISVINGKVFISDYDVSRILIYNSIPTTNGKAADVVIGQQDFISGSSNQGGSANANTLRFPGPVASDGTKLFVADYDNNRVLIYNRIPTSNNASADVVIGQPNMTTTSAGTTATKFKQPWGIFYDSTTGKLIISEYGNSRVLIYNSVPTTNGAPANLVLGQADFTSGSVNRGGSANGGTMNQPYYAKIIQNKLFVVDRGNERVLVWNSLPTTNGVSADYVIGQQNLTTVSANQGGTTRANTLYHPSDIDYSNGELFIQDENNKRVLIYHGVPTTSNPSAYKVIGQSNFTGNSNYQGTGIPAANNLVNTDGGLFVYGNQLFVVDNNDARVLIFNTSQVPFATGPDLSLTETSAIVSWRTSNSMSSMIEYGLSSSYNVFTPVQHTNPAVTSHSISLTGLTPCKTYHYKISSNSPTSDTAFTNDLTFNTKGSCVNFLSNWVDSNDLVAFEPTLPNNFQSDNVPTFVFSRAKDATDGIRSYEILVRDRSGNERTFIDNISDSSTQEDINMSDRSIHYDFRGHKIAVKGLNGNFKLEDGAYKWRVKAVNGKGAAILSSDRTLLVNTHQAVFSNTTLNFPLQLIQVGNQNRLSISSYDKDTPKQLTLSTRRPTFFGISNVGAHVKLTLVKNMGTYDDTHSYEANVNDQSRFGINVSTALYKGTYQVQLSATNDSGDYVDLPYFSIDIK